MPSPRPRLPRPKRALTAAVLLASSLGAVHAMTPDEPGPRPTRRVRAAATAVTAVPAAPTPPSQEVRVIAQAAADAEADRLAAAQEAAAGRVAEPPAPAAAPDGSVWDRLAQCESSGDWAATRGTYEGGLQFHPGTWDSYRPAGYPAAAYEASREQQIAVAERVLAAEGWSAWPACSAELGLR